MLTLVFSRHILSTVPQYFCGRYPFCRSAAHVLKHFDVLHFKTEFTTTLGKMAKWQTYSNFELQPNFDSRMQQRFDKSRLTQEAQIKVKLAS